MKQSDKLLKEAMNSLLNEELSADEACMLRDEGYKLKKPTRKAAVVIALYKKAVSGDLSAIKELRSLISETQEIQSGRKVIILDDIADKDVGDCGKGL